MYRELLKENKQTQSILFCKYSNLFIRAVHIQNTYWCIVYLEDFKRELAKL